MSIATKVANPAKNEKLHTGLHSFTGMIWKSLILSKIECCEWGLKFADLYRSWGFESPSGHHKINNL